MIAAALERVTRGDVLGRQELRELLQALMGGEGDPLQLAALLAALRTRGETLDEIVGAAEAMRALAVKLPPAPERAIDTCGTGGDGSHSINVSTLAALCVAGTGVPVAKHGNRAASGRCGSAELLEALGVRIDVAPERAAEAVREVGFGFLYARACHPAMARVAPVRVALGFPTLFNRLGPLTNPMRVRRQLLGVARPEQLEPAADALIALGVDAAWVVHGRDGLDEISTSAPTDVIVISDGTRTARTLEPGAFVPKAGPEAIRGGDVETNARIARELLAGRGGPAADAVVLNAGAALCVAGEVEDLSAGVERADASLRLGAARAVLDCLVEFTSGLATP